MLSVKKYVFIFLQFFPIILFAQVHADFTANVTKGCVPLVVNFINQSTGSGNLTYLWDFGNGNTSNLQNPVANYINPGTYTVKLIVTNGTDYDTIIKPNYIKVFKNPQANFTVGPPNYGCVPFTINFTSNCILGDAPINSYVWDFGNGTNSNLQNPSATYTQVGYYNVSLLVTDTNGCKGNITIPNAVIASSKPTVSFTADYTSSCTAPFTVNFINQSSGMGSLTYLWRFGDGTTSTAQNPSHTYTQNGSYTVTLIVTNQYGCKDSLVIQNYINISEINAAISVSPNDTVCPNQTITFTNLSGSTSLWSFGDGGTSTLNSPTHAYSNPGTYQVILIAAPGTQCQDTATITIFVRTPPNAQFTPNSYFSCGNSITFTPNNQNGIYYHWDFGVSSTNSDTSNQIISNYTYSQEGSYYVTLTITDQYGCTGTYTNPTPIVVDFCKVNISASVNNGCKPLAVDFSPTIDCNANTTVTQYLWNFGDGQISNLQSPTHIYQDTGTFYATLTITTNLGCTAFDSIKIEIGETQHPQVSFNFTGGCANDTVHFISLSTDSNYIDTYSWTFVNDSMVTVATSNEAHPNITFEGNGIISLTYTITQNGCTTTLQLDSIFKLDGPYTENIDTVMVSCENPYLIGAVMPVIKEANRWYWDMNNDGIFEDSTVLPHPVYAYNDTCWFTYPSNQTYTIRFIAYNDSTGCFWEETLSIKIWDIKANLTVQSPTCYNNVLFNILGSQDFDPNSYLFNYGDGTSGTNFLHNFPQQSANYWAYVYMTNPIGCKDTDSVYIRVFHPNPAFVGNPLNFCVPYNISLIDSSTADTTIVHWQWTISPSSLTSTDQNPNFDIVVPGWYNVSLTVVDALGCQNTLTQQNYFYANDLIPNISSTDNTLCKGDTAYFFSNVAGAQDYIWNFGDGSPLYNGANPSHLYQDTGKYTVTLYVSNNLPGCLDSATYVNYIQIQDILADFYVPTTDTNCYPFNVQITNLTSQNYSPTWLWNFGDGTSSTEFSPFHSYVMPGQYWLTLEATTSFGCKSRDSVLITVSGPYTQIILSDSIICKGDTIFFDVTNPQNINYYNWDFGDGSSSNLQQTFHQYNFVPANGYFIPSLVYCSDVGCCQYATDTIFVHQVMANFSYVQQNGSTDSTACNIATLIFNNLSIGANSYTWNFGDGTTENAQIPSNHTYQSNGQTPQTYYITLYITSDIGCVDSIKKPFIVYPLPEIQIGQDVSICRGSSVQLTVSGGNVVMWYPFTGLDNPSSYTPLANPDSTTTYTATIYDTYGCSNTASLNVIVQQVPALSNSPDTTIIIGELVNLWTQTNQNVTYLWTPSEGLSCTDCPNPIAQPLHSTTYTVMITDTMNCFQVTGTVHIEVREEFTIDVPTAFTPNGDGNNDIIYVKGWGLKQLLEFKIYNRWGQCVFQTDDLHQGWDGKFLGKDQPSDTYAYTVKALTYAGKVLTKNGLFNLLR